MSKSSRHFLLTKPRRRACSMPILMPLSSTGIAARSPGRSPGISPDGSSFPAMAGIGVISGARALQPSRRYFWKRFGTINKGTNSVTVLSRGRIIVADGRRSVEAGSGRFLARTGGEAEWLIGIGYGPGAEFRREAAVTRPPRCVGIEQLAIIWWLEQVCSAAVIGGRACCAEATCAAASNIRSTGGCPAP